jgi:lipopolysaccharide transport system permease protein
VGLLLAALNVRYRDIKYVIPFVVQIGLFATPIAYSITLVPEKYRTLFALLNPMVGIVEGFRACLFSERPFDMTLIAVSLLTTALVAILGLYYFQKTERAFADVI